MVLFLSGIFQPIGISSPRGLQEAGDIGQWQKEHWDGSQRTWLQVLTLVKDLLCDLEEGAVPLWISISTT